MNTAGAAGAITVLRNLKTKSVGAKVRNLAKEFDGSLGVTAFEFAICGTHAAKGLKLAVGTNGLTSTRGSANVLQAAFPAGFKACVAEVDSVLMGEDADSHLSLRIDGAAVLATAARIFFRALRAKNAGQFFFGHFLEFGFANGIAEIQGYDLLRGEADLNR